MGWKTVLFNNINFLEEDRSDTVKISQAELEREKCRNGILREKYYGSIQLVNIRKFDAFTVQGLMRDPKKIVDHRKPWSFNIQS
jgi:hypothetical protein